MMTLSQEEKGLPQKISDDIIALILEENLKPGDKLPNETILSQRLDVGRSSLREAMKLLASRNIVTVRQGSGTYIAASPGICFAIASSPPSITETTPIRPPLCW